MLAPSPLQLEIFEIWVQDGRVNRAQEDSGRGFEGNSAEHEFELELRGIARGRFSELNLRILGHALYFM